MVTVRPLRASYEPSEDVMVQIFSLFVVAGALTGILLGLLVAVPEE